MTFVFFHGAQITDTLLIGTTEQISDLVVTSTDVLLKLAGGFDQLVFLKGRRLIVRLEVRVTVRHQTLKPSLHSFQSPPSADITGHISRSSVAVIRRSILESCLLQALHHLSQHGVLLQNGSWVERLSALWTAESPSLIIPVALDTPTAVVVSTGKTHWIPQ